MVKFGLLLRSAKQYQVSHALLHTYARLRMEPDETQLTNLVDYYVAQLNPREPGRADQPTAQWLQTFDQERPHLLSILSVCAERAAWQQALQLAQAMCAPLHCESRWSDLAKTSKIGLSAARRMAAGTAEALCLNNLGEALLHLGFWEEALSILHQSMALATQVNDPLILSDAYYLLGQVYTNRRAGMRRPTCFAPA